MSIETDSQSTAELQPSYSQSTADLPTLGCPDRAPKLRGVQAGPARL